MRQDINNSGDGVLHGQLLKNNGFQGEDPGLAGWGSVGEATVSQDTDNPLTTAIVSTLAITSNSSGTVGASNSGYNGIRGKQSLLCCRIFHLILPVTADTFSNYFWVKGAYSGNITVSLVSNDSTVWGSTVVIVNSNSSAFSYYETTITATTATSGNNSWHFTFDADTATDGGLNLGLPQLFPTTFHDRVNGLNAEVANVLNDMGGSFLRFPGGNNL